MQQPAKNRITCKTRLCKGHLSVTQGIVSLWPAKPCRPSARLTNRHEESLPGHSHFYLSDPEKKKKKKTRCLLFPNILIPSYSWIWRSRKTTSHLNPLTCDGSCDRGPSHPSPSSPTSPFHPPLQILTQVRVAGPTMGPERRHSEWHDAEISRFSSPALTGGVKKTSALYDFIISFLFKRHINGQSHIIRPLLSCDDGPKSNPTSFLGCTIKAMWCLVQ